MSSLKHIDKLKLERLFGMKSGFVCDFSDRTFGDFILECTGVDVYAPGYDVGGTSKANRLRTFWKRESNLLTAKLMRDMADYWKLQKAISAEGMTSEDELLYQGVVRSMVTLEAVTPIDDPDAFTPNATDKGFASLSASIKMSIADNKPEEALDRLHTFVTKYMRELCDRHGIKYEREASPHALFVQYMKFLDTEKVIDAEMSKRIMKSSSSLLDAFNSVRNNQSLAHDNPVLNRDESTYIFNGISNTLRFVEAVEHKIKEAHKQDRVNTIAWKDISFSDDEPSPEEVEAAGDAWMQSQLDKHRGK